MPTEESLQNVLLAVWALGLVLIWWQIHFFFFSPFPFPVWSNCLLALFLCLWSYGYCTFSATGSHYTSMFSLILFLSNRHLQHSSRRGSSVTDLSHFWKLENNALRSHKDPSGSLCLHAPLSHFCEAQRATSAFQLCLCGLRIIGPPGGSAPQRESTWSLLAEGAHEEHFCWPHAPRFLSEKQSHAIQTSHYLAHIRYGKDRLCIFIARAARLLFCV